MSSGQTNNRVLRASLSCPGLHRETLACSSQHLAHTCRRLLLLPAAVLPGAGTSFMHKESQATCSHHTPAFSSLSPALLLVVVLLSVFCSTKAVK